MLFFLRAAPKVIGTGNQVPRLDHVIRTDQRESLTTELQYLWHGAGKIHDVHTILQASAVSGN